MVGRMEVRMVGRMVTMKKYREIFLGFEVRPPRRVVLLIVRDWVLVPWRMGYEGE
jgi:hypothetical protein